MNRSTSTNDATVLSLACAGGHFELATILLLNGADPNHLLKVMNLTLNSFVCIFCCSI